MKEDIQIEGFWFYLYSGVFAGATLHYFVAKIIGPVVFGRGWCGWACWTVMILDFLPWEKQRRNVNTKAAYVRYVHFGAIFGISIFLFFFNSFGKSFPENPGIELNWLILGNIIYYCVGLILAIVLKDNRAFCKYVCPIPVFQKAGSKYSLLKIEIDDKKCIDCKKCEQNCPMQVKLLDYKNDGLRVMSTECILCQTCANICPMNAIKTTFKFDRGKI
jgi:polyferredoxin